jgi:hypothetical protein
MLFISIQNNQLSNELVATFKGIAYDCAIINALEIEADKGFERYNLMYQKLKDHIEYYNKSMADSEAKHLTTGTHDLSMYVHIGDMVRPVVSIKYVK